MCVCSVVFYCSPPDSSVHGIFQTVILEWVAISYSRGPSWPGGLLHWQVDFLPLHHLGSPYHWGLPQYYISSSSNSRSWCFCAMKNFLHLMIGWPRFPTLDDSPAPYDLRPWRLGNIWLYAMEGKKEWIRKDTPAWVWPTNAIHDRWL